MLQSILAVTICAEDLGVVEAAYNQFLHYRTVERGVVSAALAAHWRAPLMAGRAYVLLQPESGAPVYLRFVQAASVPGYAPLKSYGWNATEILVQDPDALAERLADSPFQIVGPPRNLSSNDNIRAMQVIGPANELLYLTRVKPGNTAFNLGTALTEVDCAFIIVCGCSDLAAARAFYAAHLSLEVTPPIGVRMSVLSKAYGQDPEALHPLAVALLKECGLIELDQYPAQATNRLCQEGELPPGVAMVTFNIASLAHISMSPHVLAESFYAGRRSVVLAGPAGEWLELVEVTR